MFKIAGFKYWKRNDECTFLIEREGNVAAQIKFLGAIHNIVISLNQSS
jgi:hypothetical protein